jgi:long-chain fatty acid transport protein
MKHKHIIFGIACAGIVAGQAHASGFRIPEASIAGLGMSNALVANALELGALPYNPAAMSFHDGTQMMGGLLFVGHDLHVTPSGGAGTVDGHSDSIAIIPNFFVMGEIVPQWHWGLNVNVPFGLESNWPANTFPILSAPATRAAHPAQSKLELININPNLSYAINTHSSVAFGVDYYHVKKVKLDTQLVAISGDGGAFGWNVAALHVSGQWSFGASYRSAITVPIDGTVNTTAATTDLPLPWMLQLGVRYQATDKFGIEFDVERTGWKKFNEIIISSAASGATLVTNTNAWDDANAFRLGASYDLTAQTQLRAGYARDLSGQGDDHFTARVPDADRHLFSVGLRHALPGDWEVEAAYMYAMVDDRGYASAQPFGTYGSDPNGTAAYNGNYESVAHLLGVGVSKKF